MASQNKPADTDSTAASSAGIEEVLRPFQAASTKFLQANFSAREAVLRQCAQTWLDFQDEVRRAEQDAYQAAMAATRKQLNATMGQPATGNLEEMYAARARAQAEYEKEVRQIQADTQAKLQAIAQKFSGEGRGGESIRQLVNQQQTVYQAYLADLQKAWSGTKSLDPQTMNAIASNILFVINAASQG